jgi:hypothetical protein
VSHVQNNLRAAPRTGPRTGEPSRVAVGDSTSYPDGDVGVGNLARE